MKGNNLMRLNLYSLIFLLNSYLSGLLIPVLSLLLIEKGISLGNLSIIMAIYSFVVIVFELPSGIMSDVIGRKKTFCISLIASILSSVFMLLGNGIIMIVIGIIFYGLSRAISSGSFDALFIDTYIEGYGNEKLNNITTRLNVLDSVGLSAGALSGGFFPEFSAHFLPNFGIYDLNLIIKISLSIIVFILSMILVTEKNTFLHKEERISLKEHIKISASFVKNNKTVICIFISVLSTGYFLSSFETYWQPHFLSLMYNNDLLYLLGIMAFLYLGVVMIGSIISNKIINKFNSKKMYLILRLIFAFLIILTSLQRNLILFIVCYISMYFIFGMANIPEGVILNSETPSRIRASILSVNSLIAQLGMLFGSLINSIIINYETISTLWIIAAVLIFLSISLTSKLLLNRKENNAKIYD
jgi:MFS family permease